LSNSAPNGDMTLAMVKDNIFNEELGHEDLGITSEPLALVIKYQGKSTHIKSHDDNKRGKSKKRSKSRKEIICYYCKEYDHMKNECRKLKVKNDDIDVIHSYIHFDP
jgi:Zinc knuckle